MTNDEQKRIFSRNLCKYIANSQKQQKETAVETAEIADSAKQVVDKAVKTEKKTIK